MDRRHYVGRQSGFEKLAALFGHAKFWTKQRLGRGGAKRHYHFRFDECNLSFEPGTAGRDFLRVGFFMNTTFAARLPLEMFDDIGDVSLRAIDTGFGERIIK